MKLNDDGLRMTNRKKTVASKLKQDQICYISFSEQRLVNVKLLIEAGDCTAYKVFTSTLIRVAWIQKETNVSKVSDNTKL